MSEKDLWNYFLLTGNINAYLSYASLKEIKNEKLFEEISATEKEINDGRKDQRIGNKKS